MNEERHGLTLEEREHLTTRTSDFTDIDLKMSLLAFASLFLICVLILAASLISRKYDPRASESPSQPADAPVVVSPVPDASEPGAQEEETSVEAPQSADLSSESLPEMPRENTEVEGNAESETPKVGP